MRDRSFVIDEGMKTTIAGVCYGAFRNWTFIIERRRLPDWHDADFIARNDFIRGVFYIISNAEKDIYTTPEMLHIEWIEHKTSMGWKHGDTKCLINRTHPLMLPWEQLNNRQRLPSSLFVSIVDTFLEAT